jgi:hypothetical protein
MTNKPDYLALDARIITAASVVAETIRDLGQVPSGHLYAGLMGTITLDQYQTIIGILKEAGVVEECNHLLTYTGPKGSVQGV